MLFRSEQFFAHDLHPYLRTIGFGDFAGHHHGHPGRGDWVAPLVIGGVIGYAITQANRPVIVQPTPTVIYPNNLPPVPVGYHYEQLLDANCNCYRWVLVSNY